MLLYRIKVLKIAKSPNILKSEKRRVFRRPETPESNEQRAST